jgi:uncharacterized repeat protein (TIGR02543 family)
MKARFFFHILVILAIFILCGCKENVINIDYELDGGINDERNVNHYYPSDLPIQLYSPTKENYEFLGWYLNNSLTGSPVTQIEANYQNITLYAKWSPKEITLEMINEVINWIANYLKVKIGSEISSNIELISKDPIHNLDIIWESSNNEVLTNAGVYKMPKVDTYITLKYNIHYDSLELMSSFYKVKVLHDERITRVSNLIFSNYYDYQEEKVYETRCSIIVRSNDDNLGTVNYSEELENFYGGKITVEANEIGKFLFWAENNRIVSKEKNYQFLATDNHVLVAYFIPNDKCAVVFLDVNDEIVDIVLVNKGEYASTNKKVSDKIGFTFIGFDSLEVVDDVHYQYAIYESNHNPCLVKVKYGYFPQEENKYKYVSLGEEVTVNCDDDYFSYWMINSNIVNYEREYSFSVMSQEIEIVAIIEGVKSKKFCANLFSGLEINEELLFLGSFSNPNNLPLIEAGFIISFGEENSNLAISSWTKASKIRSLKVSDKNEFALLYKPQAKEVINVCVYVVTNNGTREKPVYIYHYSQIETYNYLTVK